MNCNVLFDYDCIAGRRQARIRMMASVTAEAVQNQARRPLNLSVVLDRSGSMAGQKLENVKEATRLLLGHLLPTDIVSLTVFDSEIDTLVSARPVGSSTSAIDAAIRAIRDGGSTYLSGGYEQGARQARKLKSREVISRILLLTDGQANVGETRPEAFSILAGEFLEEGISTTTIGVGADYDEELLGQIATAGSGGTYFIKKPDEARAVFTEELGLLMNTAVTKLEVLFQPTLEGLQFQQLNDFASTGRGRFLVGDVYGGQTKGIVFELTIPPQEITRGLEIGKLIFSGQQATENGFVEKRFELPVNIAVVSEADFQLVRPKREVSLQSAYLVVGRAKAEAIRLADENQFDEAAAMLEKCVKTLTEMDLHDPLLDNMLADLKEQAEALREQRDYFYDRSTRKRMFTEERLIRKSMMPSYQLMEERQGKLGKKPGRP